MTTKKAINEFSHLRIITPGVVQKRLREGILLHWNAATCWASRRDRGVKLHDLSGILRSFLVAIKEPLARYVMRKLFNFIKQLSIMIRLKKKLIFIICLNY